MKTLFVVGASSDMGSELIMQVAEKYDVIWAHFLHWNDKLEKIMNKYKDKVRFIQADLLDNQSIDMLINKIKTSNEMPDHIVYLPMTSFFTQRFICTDFEKFESGWNLSIRSTVVMLQAFLPYMQKNKYGKIVFMLTANTVGTPPKFQTAYTTAKYALLGLLKSLASEYADKGITFNGVSPDMINTKFISGLPHIQIEQYADSRPNKRILLVNDVIPIFKFLLSEGSDCINGENFCIK